MTATSASAQIDLLRMPFDQYGRYKIIVEVVEALRADLGVAQLRILDIGGYQVDERFGERLPLKLFLPQDDISALDTVASTLPGYYQGDGTALQFDDGAFDLVVSADTLEHIPPALRRQFVGELARVSRAGVALVAPFFSHETELAELVLARYMQAELRYKHPFLQEHRDYGLPHVAETEQWLVARGYTTAAFPSGYVHSWLEMMVLRTLLWRLTSDDALVGALEEYYNRVLFPLERREPAYRHLIVAAPVGQGRLVEVARRALGPTIRLAGEQVAVHEQFLQQFLLQLMPMGILDRMRTEDEASISHWMSEAYRVEGERQVLERELARVEGERQALERELARVERERQALERWEAEAHRAEQERQDREQARAQMEADRDHWRRMALRPLWLQIWSRIK